MSFTIRLSRAIEGEDCIDAEKYSGGASIDAALSWSTMLLDRDADAAEALIFEGPSHVATVIRIEGGKEKYHVIRP